MHITTGAPYTELAPESSPAGLCEVSGDELAGAIPGEPLLDGSVTGAAELEGIFAEVSGVAAVAGPSAAAGLLTGVPTGAATIA